MQNRRDFLKLAGVLTGGLLGAAAGVGAVGGTTEGGVARLPELVPTGKDVLVPIDDPDLVAVLGPGGQLGDWWVVGADMEMQHPTEPLWDSWGGGAARHVLVGPPTVDLHLHLRLMPGTELTMVHDPGRPGRAKMYTRRSA